MKILRNSFLLMTFSAFFSCSKSIESPESASSADKSHSLMKGTVLLANEGNTFVEKSGMTVTLEDSDPVVSAVTDKEGNFSLPIDSSIKSFCLVYSKPLFGTYKSYFEKKGDSLFQVRSSYGGPVSKTPIMWEYGMGESLGYKSTTTVNSFQASIVNGRLRLTYDVSAPITCKEPYMRFFFQKNTPITSFASIPKTVKNVGALVPVHTGQTIADYCLSCFEACTDAKRGDTIYITAYGDSPYSNVYTDFKTNQVMMPNVNTSSNATPSYFVMP